MRGDRRVKPEMPENGKTNLEGLEEKLEKLPFALTISDITQPDQPLIFINSAFTDLTGYGQEVIGQNCRFLQGDLENEAARAEIRESIESGNRLQVVLHNRRRNGETFYNMLLLETLRTFRGRPGLAIGSQFDLGPKPPHGLSEDRPGFTYHSVMAISDQAQKIRIERRRILTEAAVRLVQSWAVLNEVPGR